MEAVTDTVHKWVCVPVKFYLHKQAEGQIWPVGVAYGPLVYMFPESKRLEGILA
jgi:hypothetical protein